MSWKPWREPARKARAPARHGGRGARAAAHRGSRRRAHLGFALALFVGAGEELAWGQHALGLTAPDPVRRWNAQDEITLHNLDFIQDLRHSVGYDVVLAAFAVVAAGYFVAAPVLAARSRRARIAIDRYVPIPPGVFGAFAIDALAAARRRLT